MFLYGSSVVEFERMWYVLFYVNGCGSKIIGVGDVYDVGYVYLWLGVSV